MRLLTAVVVLFIACTPSSPASYVALSGRFGPAGGTLVAPDDDVLAGARLDIPAGALTTEVELSFVAADDETPLPADGFRVGPQFRVEPVATALKAPVRITYPFDFAARSTFSNTDAECRVWQRDGDGWKGVAQVASDENGVTIETSSFALAAPGVQRIVILNVCLTNPQLCALPGPCTSPMGICMERLPDPSPKPFSIYSVGVSRAKLVYASRPFNEPIRGVVYSYPTGQTTVSPPLAHPSMGTSFGRPDMTATEDVWVALPGPDTVKFPRVAPPERFDTQSTRISRGVFVSSSNVVSRFVQDTVNAAPVYRLVRDDQQFTIVSDFPSNTAINFVPRRGQSTFIAWNRKRGLVFFSGTANETVEHLVQPPSGFFVADVATSYRSGAFAVLFVRSDGAQRKLSMFSATPTSRTDVTNRRDFDDVIATQLEYGTDDRLYAFTSSRAQLDVYNFTTGGVSSIPLSNAATESAEYRQMLPLVLRNVHPTGELLLITAGTTSPAANFYFAIKRAGTP